MALKLATVFLVILLTVLVIMLGADVLALMDGTATVETGQRIITTIVVVTVICLVLLVLSGLETCITSG